MRVTVLAIALMLAGGVPALAQVSYGVKAGVNVANLSFDADTDVSSKGRIGLLAGVFVTIPIGGWLTVQSEAIYTAKGATLDIADLESTYLVDYLEVPVLLRVELPRRAYAVAGPSMAYRIRARNRVAFDGSTEEIDLGGDVESFDLGIVAGVGLDIGRWVLDGRYTHGLSDSDADTTDDVRIRNRVVSLAAGFRF
jgi:hypothetical protein